MLFLEEWKSSRPDMDTIYNEIDTASEAKKVFAKKVADAVVELHKILTPDQREVITDHIEEHMEQAQEFLKSN